ncbi:MAG: two-component system sensor histidine kinase NtrB, partial [Gemmatimonadaceae bacterium]
LALRHPGSPAAQENLGEMIGEVDRLDRRISHLLNFSRPAPGHPLRENATQLVNGLLASLSKLADGRGVSLDVSLDSALPDAHMDPIQMEQALLEIVANAMDAMPKGGRLRLATHSDTDAHRDGTVVIEIADSGPGIPADLLASVCEPFFTTRADGTGLGLAIAKRYVEQSGGTLAITSGAGEGTRVCIAFPALPGEDAAGRGAAHDPVAHSGRST